MTFVFWQNMISIHQKDFLEALSRLPGTGKVVLVAAHDIAHYRKMMGWEVPELHGVEVVISPTATEAKDIVNRHKDAVHIMGGIRIGHIMSVALDACIARKCRLGIMTEPYDAAGIKGVLRKVKYTWYKLRYARNMQFILTIGRQAGEQYKSLGYKKELLYPWAYFISPAEASPAAVGAAAMQRIIYAGRIDERKGIYRFVKELVNAGGERYKLDIYGSGPQEALLQTLIDERGLQERIRVYPFIKYEDLVKKYSLYDWVALPSTGKDGWGVIVSEGLMTGLKAICSSLCGASQVVNNGVNGVVFDWSKKGSCTGAIDSMLKGKGFAAKEQISKRAAETISGTAGAAYFIQIMNSVYGHKERPQAPWTV